MAHVLVKLLGKVSLTSGRKKFVLIKYLSGSQCNCTCQIEHHRKRSQTDIYAISNSHFYSQCRIYPCRYSSQHDGDAGSSQLVDVFMDGHVGYRQRPHSCEQGLYRFTLDSLLPRHHGSAFLPWSIVYHFYILHTQGARYTHLHPVYWKCACHGICRTDRVGHF